MEYRKGVLVKGVFFIFAVVAAFNSGFAVADDREQALCDSKKIIHSLISHYSSIEDYSLRFSTTIGGESIDSIILGKTPGYLMVEMFFKSSSAKVVFDKKYQWIESKTGETTNISKIDLIKVTIRSRPFDTSYNLTGSGLINGEDFPQTVLTLLQIYDLKAHCTDGKIHLFGNINTQKYSDYLAQPRIKKIDPRYSSRFIKEFGIAGLVFGASDMRLIKYHLGNHLLVEKFVAKISYLEVNKGIADEAFVYTPHLEPVDITQEVLRSINN